MTAITISYEIEKIGGEWFSSRVIPFQGKHKVGPIPDAETAKTVMDEMRRSDEACIQRIMERQNNHLARIL